MRVGSSEHAWLSAICTAAVLAGRCNSSLSLLIMLHRRDARCKRCAAPTGPNTSVRTRRLSVVNTACTSGDVRVTVLSAAGRGGTGSGAAAAGSVVSTTSPHQWYQLLRCCTVMEWLPGPGVN